MLDYAKEISIIHRYGIILMDSKIKSELFPVRLAPYIAVICGNPGLSQEDIAAELRVDKGSVARAVNKLHSMGFIDRVEGEKDRRINRIYPSEKMLSIHEINLKARDEILDILIRGMTEEEIEVFDRAIVRMRENVVTEVSGCRKTGEKKGEIDE